MPSDHVPPGTSESAGESERIGENADQWVDRYGDALYRYALAKTGDTATAEDLVQETLLAGFKRRDSFRQQATISTWLFSILKHKIADHFRAAARRPSLEQLGPETPVGSVDARISASSSRDPAVLSEDAEFQKIFQSCVDRLPNKFAEVYALRETNGHSLEEIREILNISPTNLSMRLHRCRLALRECLQRNWFQESG